MTTSNFQIAFNVDVSHSYFKNDICSGLKYTYGAATQAFVARFDARIRKRVSGFGFYINTRSPLSSFLQYACGVTGQTYFDFDISAANPAFNFFTESPAGWLGAFIYDSGSSLNKWSGSTIQLIAAPSPANTPFIGVLRVHFNDIINNGAMQVIRHAQHSGNISSSIAAQFRCKTHLFPAKQLSILPGPKM